MNKTQFFGVVFLGFAFAGTLHAEVVLATGVQAIIAGDSANAGWYDANKNTWSVKWSATTVEEATASGVATDDYMCWAGTASNMLQWGVDRLVAAGMSSAIKSEASLGFDSNRHYQTRAQTNIYKTFCENWTDGGYWEDSGITWWMTGDPGTKEDENCSKLRDGATGGNYWATPITNIEYYVRTENAYYYGDDPGKDFGCGKASFADFIEAVFDPGENGLDGCIAGLSIYQLLENGELGGGHAITCWGYELDDDGFVTKLFITDSDDSADNTSTHTAGEADQYDADALGFVMRAIDVSYRGDEDEEIVVFEDLYFDYDYALGGVTFFNPFGLLFEVPEPSLFGLFAGVFALAFAGTRRRRKSSNTK